MSTLEIGPPDDRRAPMVGVGYRRVIDEWIQHNIELFDVLEVTVDHYIRGGLGLRVSIDNIVGRIPVVMHGVGLSIGTDVPVDLQYLDQVAEAVAKLGAPSYSEHLAFTRVPGRDLANLMPLPRTEAIAEGVIEKVRIVQSRVGVPFHLENISYLFDWPDSTLNEAEFINLICRETGAGVLLDVENLHINSVNYDYDPMAFLDDLSTETVKGIHAAGGALVEGVLADSHDHPVSRDALELLEVALDRFHPDTIIVERDDQLHRTDQLGVDVERIRECVAAATARQIGNAGPNWEGQNVESVVARPAD